MATEYHLTVYFFKGEAVDSVFKIADHSHTKWYLKEGSFPKGLNYQTYGGGDVLPSDSSSLRIFGHAPDTSFSVIFDTDNYFGTTVGKLFLTVVAESHITLSFTDKEIPKVLYVNENLTSGVRASGGIPPYKYKISGELSNDLKIDPDSGVLSGQVKKTGFFNFSVGASDSQGSGGHSGSDNGWIHYDKLLVVEPLFILPLTLHRGKTNEPYTSEVITADDAVLPVTFRSRGNVPGGMSINPDSGSFSGTPTTPGTYVFELGAIDSSELNGTSRHLEGWRRYTVVIEEAEIILHPDSLPAATAGTPYSATISASGGTGKYTYKKWTDAPAGLTVNPTTGAMTWTPDKAGSYNFYLGATDSAGNGGHDTGDNGWKKYTVSVSEAQIALHPDSLPAATAGTPYSATISASGGTGKYTFRTWTDAPHGLSVDRTSGKVTWTPAAAGNYSFYLGATDSAGNGGHDTGDNGWKKYTVSVQLRDDIAISDLTGTFVSGTPASVSITGKISGALIGKNTPPTNIKLFVRSADKATFDNVDVNKITWEPVWKSDGWGFTIRSVPLPQETLPKFIVKAESGNLDTSEETTVLFPLQKFFTAVNFVNAEGTESETLSMKPGQPYPIRFHLNIRHPLDSLSVSVQLPDHMTASSPKIIGKNVTLQSDWNGRDNQMLFTYRGGVSGTLNGIVDFTAEVRVTDTFVSGNVLAEVTSDSGIVRRTDDSIKIQTGFIKE